MAEIPLTRGKVALVDDEDLPLIANYAWFSRLSYGVWYAWAYVRGSGRRGKRNAAMHRVITGALPGQIVDHRNGNGLDNRRCNLRICGNSVNTHNIHREPRGVSGYHGVKRARSGLWVARIQVNGRQVFLGSYPDEKLAGAAYDGAARALYGCDSTLNFRRYGINPDPASDPALVVAGVEVEEGEGS